MCLLDTMCNLTLALPMICSVGLNEESLERQKVQNETEKLYKQRKTKSERI